MAASVALHRGWRKAVRTVVQVVASGGLTAAVDAVAGGLDPNTRVMVAAVWLVVVTFCQNALETRGTIPALLPTPGLVPSAGKVAEPVVGVVETTVDRVGDAVGDVEGVVTDLTGDLLGEVNPPGEEGET